MFDLLNNASLSQILIVVCNEKYQKVMLNLMRIKFEIEECPIIRPFDATCSLMHDAGTLTPAKKSCNCQIAIEVHGILLPTYLIFVIFFTRAKFLANKIYTEKRQFFALNL